MTNAESVESKKRKGNQFRLSIGQNQKDFIDKLTKATNLRKGELIWQSVLFANNQKVAISLLNEYFNFIYDKKHGIVTYFQKVMTSHVDLKNASEHYKKEGYNIGIKGVVLLYLLNYASNYLRIDISEYKNFN
ncbi:MAG: hypothetical protein J6574_01620 [Gilliamella sp.]|nr:hypothetical protein [Gilliamella sp.]